MKTIKFFAALCCVAVGFAACKPQNEPEDENKIIAGIENGHAWVSLGLPSGTKWATCNVGAATPEAYGDYYAWGEIEPKTTYNWSTYKWCEGSKTTLTKYNTKSKYGTVIDNKTVLDPEDDIAAVNWGGAWRMPTEAEWTELREKCEWTWTDDYNGTNVAGYIVASKINLNSIFLPATSHRGDDDLMAGSGYWSSEIDGDYPYEACYLLMHSVYTKMSNNTRDEGYPVRPVLK